MVKQILLNILSNAVKFAPGGEVHLTARIGEDGGLVIEAADTGIGMSAADIAVALTPFGQVANASRARKPAPASDCRSPKR